MNLALLILAGAAIWALVETVRMWRMRRRDRGLHLSREQVWERWGQ